MRDADVRAALHLLLREEHAHELPTTRVRNEFGLCGMVRVDVAVLNGHLAGYELKSASDTLARLPMQVSVYSRVLDRATLVVAERHLEAARRLLPDWWGIIVARGAAGAVTLVHERMGLANPDIRPEALVQLLWRDELLAELHSRGIGQGRRSHARAQLAAALVAATTCAELGAVVRARLAQRDTSRAGPPRGRGGAAFPAVATPWRSLLHSLP